MRVLAATFRWRDPWDIQQSHYTLLVHSQNLPTLTDDYFFLTLFFLRIWFYWEVTIRQFSYVPTTSWEPIYIHTSNDDYHPFLLDKANFVNHTIPDLMHCHLLKCIVPAIFCIAVIISSISSFSAPLFKDNLIIPITHTHTQNLPPNHAFSSS